MASFGVSIFLDVTDYPQVFSFISDLCTFNIHRETFGNVSVKLPVVHVETLTTNVDLYLKIAFPLTVNMALKTFGT